MPVHQQIITNPKMPLYKSDFEDEPNDLAATLKQTVNGISGETFGENKRGFQKDKKQTTTDESVNLLEEIQEEQEKREQKQAEQKAKKKKKIPKQAEYEFPMSERPEVKQKEEESQEPIKCVKCRKMIKPKDPCYMIDCSDGCDLYLDTDCFKNEMTRQGKTKKKDQKDAVCPTDSCPGKIYEIVFRNYVDGEIVDTIHLVCNARPTGTTKEDKKMLKKMVKHNESTSSAPFERITTESSEIGVQQEVEEVKEPEAPPKPIDLNAPVHRLEKHDDIADKYGLNEQDNGVGKKDKERKKKHEKSKVTLNMVDKKIEEKAHRKRNESNDFEEPSLRASRETSSTPLSEIDDFPSFTEPQSSSTLGSNGNEDFEAEMLDQRFFPRVDDLNNLENLVEEIKPFKESILGNCPDSGELYQLQGVFMLVLSDEQIQYTRSGQKLEDVRKSVEIVFHDRHLTSADGGLAKKFLGLTKWFIISKARGKIMFKKKPQASIATTSNLMREPTLIAQATSVSPPIEREPIRFPPSFTEKENLNERSGPEKISKEIMNKLRISTNNLTSSSTSNETHKKPSLGQQHTFEKPVFKPKVEMSVPSQPFNSRTVVPPSPTVTKHLIPPPGILNAPTGGFNRPPGLPAVPQQPTQSTQRGESTSPWNDIELENKRLKEELEKMLKEKDEIDNAYRGILRENTGLQKLKDRLKTEIDVLKTSANAQDERSKEEQNLWTAEKEKLVEELNRAKLVKDGPEAQLLQTELTKLQKETNLSMEKRTALKRKEFAEGTMHHIVLICTSLQSLLIEDRMEADEKNLRQRQLKDFEKIHFDWEMIHRATVKRLYELETNGTSDTVIPKPPAFTNICIALYEEFIQQPRDEMKAPVMKILKEIQDQVQSQCTRHTIEQPDEPKLKYLIARYVANNREVLGVSRVINKDKCMNYVLDQLGVPRKYESTNGSMCEQQPWSSATLSFPSLPSTSTHNYIQAMKSSAIGNVGSREIDFATHECKVCFDVLETKERAKQCTGCYEPFHHECIKKWLMQTESQTNSCPNCKKVWPDEEAYPSL
ncbi:unnamed protein product, partial [Mesorhabditis belari]|uniref:RING-type domain-containing protein n=1 Tax=Mesorhabditis belari TaxID=2138241 RepID=A0AAF3J792_9BILA